MHLDMRDFAFERVVRAIERVQENLVRATAMLSEAGIAHAVTGSSAVYEWIASHDESGVRFTKYAELLVERDDLPSVQQTFSAHFKVAVLSLEAAKARCSVVPRPRPDVVLEVAESPLSGDSDHLTPKVQESETLGTFNVVALNPLVQMK